MAIMEWIMRIGFALSLVVSMAWALDVTIPQKEYEFARGDNITLPCKFVPKNPTNPLVIISWTREGDKPGAPESQILTYYSTSKTLDIKEKYTGRVTLDHNIATGKADLKLSSITLAENRVFECRVSIPKDDEGKPAATTRLIVLVAPSKPICKIEGTVEYGQNINLTCMSEEGSPKPTYKWDTRDVRNAPRAPDPRTIDKGGILSLFNLTKETSGFYICTSSNKIRAATCNVTVAVMPPSMNIGSTAGIIGGAVAALIVLIIVIYCCCCRKKEKEEDYAMGVREEGEYRDKEQPENGERPYVDRLESVRSDDESSVRNASNRHEERSEREYDRRSDYDDRQSDYDDRRSDYSDRRDKYNDRDDRRDDRRRDDDRRYDDERRNDDDSRYDDDRRDRSYKDDRYDEPYDEDDRRPPKVPSKPSREEYDD